MSTQMPCLSTRLKLTIQRHLAPTHSSSQATHRLVCLQLKGESGLPPLDLRALPQLTDLLLDPEHHGYVTWVAVPPQLRSFTLEHGKLVDDCWRFLCKARHLRQLSCPLWGTPSISPESLPGVELLELGVHTADALPWAALLAGRCGQAQLNLHVDPAALMQPRFRGLQLHRLHLYDHPCTAQVWQNLSVRTMSVFVFKGSRISGDMLPRSMESGLLWPGDATKVTVAGLEKCATLRELTIIVRSTCALELHGSFSESQRADWRTVSWLGPKKCLDN